MNNEDEEEGSNDEDVLETGGETLVKSLPVRETATPTKTPLRPSLAAAGRGSDTGGAGPDLPALLPENGNKGPSANEGPRVNEAPHEHKRQRVLTVKCVVDWRDEESKALFNRLKDLSWQAASYRNNFLRRMWAEAMGYGKLGTVTLDRDQIAAFLAGNENSLKIDKNALTKEARRNGEKGELSGAAYSAAEREVAGVWKRDAKFIMAGRRFSEWSATSALSVRGHKVKAESGIRIEEEADYYVAWLQAQAKTCPGGCWLKIPIARGTEKDWHAPILDAMIDWEIPIAKAAVVITGRAIKLKLSYAQKVPLPAMGARIAILGPLESDGRIHLRTETQRKDYTSKLREITVKKNDWDGIRRRALRQIGWRKGHARTKREVLARYDWADWLDDHLHVWSAEVVAWCKTQGVGTIQVGAIDNGDWPAFKFRQMLEYKAADLGMKVVDLEVLDEGATRAAKAAIEKRRRRAKRTAEAIRDINDDFERTA